MMTCENFGTYSHEQIRHEMYDGAGPNSQGDAMAGWHQLAGRLTAIRQYVDSAISGLQASQQGAAADAAVGAMVPLGSWVDEAQRLANDTRNRIDNRISEFTTARNNVPEVPPEPRGGGWMEVPVIDSFTTSDQEADEAFNAEQERQARAAMISYQIGTNDQVMSVAQFAPPPTGEVDLSIPAGNRSTIGGFPGGAGGGGAGGGGAVPGAPTPSAGVGTGMAAELSASTGPQGSGGPGVPPGGGGPGVPDGGGRPAPTVLPAPVGGVPGVAPRTPAAGGPRGPGSGRVGAGRGGPGGGPGGGAAGMRGEPGAGGFRPQGGGPGGGFGPERGGFGPTGSPKSAAARAASAGAAGTGAGGAGRGAANAGGVPFGGMGGGRGGEDNERRRPSYLIEPDSNRLIGELPWTAPAVIGEDLPDDDEPTRR